MFASFYVWPKPTFDIPSVTKTLNVRKNLHLMKIVFKILCKAETEGQSRSHGSLAISFCVGNVADKFLANLRNWLNGNLIGKNFPNFNHFLNSFYFEIWHKHFISEVVNRYLNVGVKINDCDEGFRSIFLYPFNILWNAHLNNLFTRDVFKRLLLLAFGRLLV